MTTLTRVASATVLTFGLICSGGAAAQQVIDVTNAPASRETYMPSEGYVPDEKTAIAIAEAVLVPVYGAALIHSEKPFKARLIGDRWEVTGTLPCAGMPMCMGGTALVEISKRDGTILRMIHYK